MNVKLRMQHLEIHVNYQWLQIFSTLTSLITSKPLQVPHNIRLPVTIVHVQTYDILFYHCTSYLQTHLVLAVKIVQWFEYPLLSLSSYQPQPNSVLLLSFRSICKHMTSCFTTAPRTCPTHLVLAISIVQWYERAST